MSYLKILTHCRITWITTGYSITGFIQRDACDGGFEYMPCFFLPLCPNLICPLKSISMWRLLPLWLSSSINSQRTSQTFIDRDHHLASYVHNLSPYTAAIYSSSSLLFLSLPIDPSRSCLTPLRWRLTRSSYRGTRQLDGKLKVFAVN